MGASYIRDFTVVLFFSLTLGGGNAVVNNVVKYIVAEIDDDLNYVSHETRLLGDLLNGYNKMAIPLYNSSTNVTVTISLIPVNLIELVCIHNSKEKMRWQDYFDGLVQERRNSVANAIQDFSVLNETRLHLWTVITRYRLQAF